jgi:Ran GTPase-activating protein (RanGAP) involved in mRNA processing and transport
MTPSSSDGSTSLSSSMTSSLSSVPSDSHLHSVTDLLAVTLYITKVRIDNDDFARTIDEEITNIPGVNTPRWKRLEIVSCRGSRIPQLLATALEQKSIEHFTIRKIVSRVEDCIQAMCSNGIRYLKELVLELTLSDRSCRCLASAMKSSTTLTTLRFEQCSFSSLNTGRTSLDVLADGLKSNTSISTLSFTKCQLRDEDLRLLISKLPSSIKKLELVDNYCRSEGMAALTALLLRNCHGDRALESLNLTNQHPGEYGGSLYLSPFGLALASNGILKDLDLSFNMLTIENIRDLVDALGKNCSLQKLNLMSNQLDDQAVDYIGRNLPQMKGLKYLNITANRFGENGADSLQRGLKGNVSLEQLLMPLGFAASEDIDYLLALNQGGRRLLHIEASTATVPLGLWPFVFQRINGRQSMMYKELKPSVVFFLLKGKVMFGCEGMT